MSPSPSTVRPQQPQSVSYSDARFRSFALLSDIRSTSALSSSWGTRQLLSVFSTSKKDLWHRTQWSLGGGTRVEKNDVNFVRVVGDGGSGTSGSSRSKL